MLGAIASSGGASVFEPPPPGEVVVNADFSLGPLGNAGVPQIADFNRIHAQETNRVQIVDTPVDQGAHSLRCEVRLNDVDLPLSKGTERVQVSGQSAPRIYFQQGDDIWTAISYYLPAAPGFNTPTTGKWQLLYQTYPNMPSLTSPGTGYTLAIGVAPSNMMRLIVRGGVWSAANPFPHSASLDLGDAVRDVWHHVLFRTVLDATSGSVDVWYRQKGGAFPSPGPTAGDVGPNLQTKDAQVKVVYPQLNIYRSHRAETDHMFFGLYRVATTRELAEGLWV